MFFGRILYVCIILYYLICQAGLGQASRTYERIYIIEVSLDSYQQPKCSQVTVNKNNHGACRTPLDLVKKKNSFRIPQYGSQIQEITTRISKRYITIMITIMNSNKKVKNKKKYLQKQTPRLHKTKKKINKSNSLLGLTVGTYK